TQAITGEPTVVAAKVGYRSAGESFTALPLDLPVTLVLYAIEPPDNEAYVFGAPGVGDLTVDDSTAVCGHCHTTLTKQFQSSAHAKATRDPLVQDLYAGTASGHMTAAACALAGGVFRDGTSPGAPGVAVGRCYVGDGALPDLNGCGAPAGKSCDDPSLPSAQKPTKFGACADCHGLGMDGPAGGRDLLEATGVGFENGNHCDACHHIADVDPSKPPGNAGRLVMQRPREKIGDPIQGMTRQAMFGPYPDVPITFMGGSYQPKFTSAELCSGCHEQKQGALLPGSSLDVARWPDGLPTHSTYSEWQAGPFNTPASQCQSCHMPVETSLFSSIDAADSTNAGITFGFERAEGTIRSHWFRGPLTVIPGVPRLIDGAAGLTVTATPAGSVLDVDVTALNQACGHAIPTGEPMRGLVLVVRVDGCGQPFAATGGQTIDDVGDALATGTAGSDATFAGATVSWPAGAARAAPGDVVRLTHPTGTFIDYDGVGLFEGSALPASQKGLPLDTPAGEATVLSVTGDVLTLSTALAPAAGDRVLLGSALPALFADGDASRALAGQSGATFAKILVDPSGRRRVPHHRAVDVVRDNRIRPQLSATTHHSFAIPPACTDATVTATLLYRPTPADLARQRGWEAHDYVVQSKATQVTIP
ncbi:MAG TPA: hypothetical protein VL400_19485, partial [Polyangiaceae bacterium]|nr:hypothetical protein [Polyangiaceae bacterium]